MSAPVSNAASAPVSGGVQTVLRYTGLPPWLFKRPKLPSRNWLIFWSVTATATGYYFYDRRECKRIRQHYVDLVQHQAEEFMRPLDAPRRVMVYGAKWPGDEDYEQAMRHFRKYVKPVLVAAAVDYDIVVGKRHGDIAERVANDIRLRRRRELGIDPIPETMKLLPTYKSPEQARQHELDGGIVLVGRPTLKEFMAGLKKGWTEGLDHVDHDEILSQELASDGRFDEVDDEAYASEVSAAKSAFPDPHHSPVFSPLQTSRSPPSSSTASQWVPEFPSSRSSNDVPETIPSLPPLLLIPLTDYIGLSQIPVMFWDWLNQRYKVRTGAEAAYRLIKKQTRPVICPAPEPVGKFADLFQNTPADKGDLDFGKNAEEWYKSSLNKLPSEIEKERKKYYEELPARLSTARAIARGMRELTKDEVQNPPLTEVELSAERMKKEKRWRRDVAAWDIIKPEQEVTWDERFRSALQIFTDSE